MPPFSFVFSEGMGMSQQKTTAQFPNCASTSNPTPTKWQQTSVVARHVIRSALFACSAHFPIVLKTTPKNDHTVYATDSSSDENNDDDYHNLTFTRERDERTVPWKDLRSPVEKPVMSRGGSEPSMSNRLDPEITVVRKTRSLNDPQHQQLFNVRKNDFDLYDLDYDDDVSALTQSVCASSVISTGIIDRPRLEGVMKTSTTDHVIGESHQARNATGGYPAVTCDNEPVYQTNGENEGARAEKENLPFYLSPKRTVTKKRRPRNKKHAKNSMATQDCFTRGRPTLPKVESCRQLEQLWETGEYGEV